MVQLKWRRRWTWPKLVHLFFSLFDSLLWWNTDEFSFLWLSIKLLSFTEKDEAVGEQLISLLSEEVEEEGEDNQDSDVKSFHVTEYKRISTFNSLSGVKAC